MASSWVVKYRGSVIAGPFMSQGEALYAQQQKSQELWRPLEEFDVVMV